MTAQTTDIYPGNVRPEDTDVIDLRHYLLVLLQWWREILLITIFAGVATGGALVWRSYNQTPTYKAHADILIARLMSNIELDSRVSTTNAANQVDANSWRASLLKLASSTVVANAVGEELGDELPNKLNTPEGLLGAVSAEIPLSDDGRFASNLVRISVTTPDPELSARIANSWVHHLVDYINGLYGEVPESIIENVTAEREEALLNYQMAQKAYEEFIANNRINELTRQIQEKTQLRDGIMSNYSQLLTAVVNTEYTASVNLYTTLANAARQHATALITTQSAGTLKSIDRLYNLRASAIAQLNQAQMMERSLVEGGEAAAKSNAVALQMLKLATFAALYNNDLSVTATLPLTSAMPVIEMSLEEQLVDVRALINVLEEHIAALEEEIQTIAATGMVGADPAALAMVEGNGAIGESTEGTIPDIEAAYAQLLGPESALNQAPEVIREATAGTHQAMLETLESEIRTLQAELSAEEAKQRELTHRRDLAWTTYETVGAKLEELNLLRSSANSEVRIGNLAIAPASPQPKSSPLLPTLAVTALAFFAAVVLAIVVNAVGGEPFFARRTA